MLWSGLCSSWTFCGRTLTSWQKFEPFPPSVEKKHFHQVWKKTFPPSVEKYTFSIFSSTFWSIQPRLKAITSYNRIYQKVFTFCLLSIWLSQSEILTQTYDWAPKYILENVDYTFLVRTFLNIIVLSKTLKSSSPKQGGNGLICLYLILSLFKALHFICYFFCF